MLQIGSVFSVFLMLQALKIPKIKPLGRGVFYALVLVWAFAQFNGLQYNVNSLIGVSTLLSNAETIRILAVWVLGLEILEMAYHKFKIVTRCIKSNYLKALCFGIFFSLLNLYLNLEWHLFMVMESWVLFRALGFFMTSFRLRSRLNWITKCVFIAGLSLYFFNHIENTSNLFIKQAARNWQVKQNANTDSLFANWFLRVKTDSALGNLIAFLPQSDAELNTRIRSHAGFLKDQKQLSYSILSKRQGIVLKSKHAFLNTTVPLFNSAFKGYEGFNSSNGLYKSGKDTAFYIAELPVNSEYSIRLFFNPMAFNGFTEPSLLPDSDTEAGLFFNPLVVPKLLDFKGQCLWQGAALVEKTQKVYLQKLKYGSSWQFNVIKISRVTIVSILASLVLVMLLFERFVFIVFNGDRYIKTFKTSIWHQNVWIGAGLSAIITALILIWVFNEFQSEQEALQTQRGIALAVSVAEDFKKEFQNASVYDPQQRELWKQKCFELQLQQQVPVMLVDSQGRALFHSFNYIPGKPVSDVWEARINPQSFSINLKNHSTWYFSEIRFASGSKRLFAGIENSKEARRLQLVQFKLANRFIYFALIFLFVGTGLSAVINYRIIKPLRQLGEQLPKISLDQTNYKIQISGSGDLAQLIQSYNRLIDRIENNLEVIKLKEQSKALKNLALQVAHDIRNPLTPLKLNLQYLIHVFERDPEAFSIQFQSKAHQLIQQIEHINQMVQRFSDFSGSESIKIQSLEFEPLLNAALSLIPQKVQVNLSNTSALTIMGESQSVLRVLNNLLQNAVQAIEHNTTPQITINTFKNDEPMAVIEIEDNGKGIPAERRTQLFKYQFSSKTSGSGMGLMLSQELMKAMGGQIEYYEPVLGGTGFRLFFKV